VLSDSHFGFILFNFEYIEKYGENFQYEIPEKYFLEAFICKRNIVKLIVTAPLCTK
jgi:hypothetical protein